MTGQVGQRDMELVGRGLINGFQVPFQWGITGTRSRNSVWSTPNGDNLGAFRGIWVISAANHLRSHV